MFERSACCISEFAAMSESNRPFLQELDLVRRINQSAKTEISATHCSELWFVLAESLVELASSIDRNEWRKLRFQQFLILENPDNPLESASGTVYNVLNGLNSPHSSSLAASILHRLGLRAELIEVVAAVITHNSEGVDALITPCRHSYLRLSSSMDSLTSFDWLGSQRSTI